MRQRLFSFLSAWILITFRHAFNLDSLPCISDFVRTIQKASMQIICNRFGLASCRVRNVVLVLLLTLLGCYAVAVLVANTFNAPYCLERSAFLRDRGEEGIISKSLTAATLHQVQGTVVVPIAADGKKDSMETADLAVSAFDDVAKVSITSEAPNGVRQRTHILPVVVPWKAPQTSWGLPTSTPSKSRHIARVKRRTGRSDEETYSTRQQTQNDSRRRRKRRDMCTKYRRSKECYRRIIEFAHAYQQNGTVVIVVTARGSYDVIINWCISMRRLHLSNYFLVAMDDEAHDFFQRRNAPVVQVTTLKSGHKVSRSDVWIERTFVAYMILKEGINVLVSDADAVMMKSPFGRTVSFFNNDGIDIISSPSNFPNKRKGELPSECASAAAGATEWRHQLCMGWTFFRSKRKVVTFFDELFLPDVLRYKDDQIGFNCAMRRAGAVWKEGHRWTIWKVMVSVSKWPKLRLALLPAAIYVRNCTAFEDDRRKGYGISGFDTGKVELYHCKGNKKKRNAENNGFWFVRRDWERHTYGTDVSFAEVLRSVAV